MLKHTILVAAVAGLVLALAGTAQASAIIVPITAITGSHGGDYYGNGMISLIDGSGMTRPDVSDPSTWSCSETSYNQTLMSDFLVAALNSKLAWVALDLGATTNVKELYLWNIRYQNGPAGTQTYNLYYANSPTVSLPAQPGKATYSTTGLTPQGDYDFSSGGWTQFNTSGVLTLGKTADDVVDIRGIPSARYLALEILTNYGDNYQGGRVGFNELAVAIPEPATMALLGLGGLGVLLRRKRR